MKLMCALAAFVFAASASYVFPQKPAAPTPDIHYVPTSGGVADAMLKLAQVTANDVVYDLGSGDGRIVINASVSGIRNPNPGLSLYSASKAAVISLMRSVAMEAAPRGVRINAIAPGRVVTDMMLRSGVGDMSAVAAGLPLRRMGKPEEVAEAVVWLASDAASYVVGHVLAADGGFLAS